MMVCASWLGPFTMLVCASWWGPFTMLIFSKTKLSDLPKTQLLVGDKEKKQCAGLMQKICVQCKFDCLHHF